MRYITAIIPAFFLCGSCSSLTGDMHLTDEQSLAVCASQRYLKRNGYLDSGDRIDTSKIDLELFDPINYSQDGVINWEALLKDRNGSFSNKLYGVKKDGSNFVVIYRHASAYSCVSVSSDRTKVFLHEPNCKPNGPLARIQERLTKCDS